MRTCSTRIHRVASHIRRNIAIILQFKIRDPRVAGIVTVLGIDVAKDLSYARVFITFVRDITLKQLEQKLKILQKASGFIRSSLAKIMSLRIIPELFFVYDDSLVQSIKVYHLLTGKHNSF